MYRAVRKTNFVLFSWSWTLVLEGSVANPPEPPDHLNCACGLGLGFFSPLFPSLLEDVRRKALQSIGFGRRALRDFSGNSYRSLFVQSENDRTLVDF